MWTVEKAIGLVFVVGVLTFQAWAIFPPDRMASWYWPFLNYPMYSTPHLPGEVFTEHAVAIELQSADAAAPLVAAGIAEELQGLDEDHVLIGPAALGVHRFTHYRTLDRMARVITEPELAWEGYVESEVERLARQIEERIDAEATGVLLLQRSFAIDQGRLVDDDPPWEVISSWRLPGVATGQAPGEVPR